MQENMINIQGLSKLYGHFKALDQLDLQVKKGTITCFLGPNGAGKSTTIRLLLGLQRPSEGQAEIFGWPPGDPRGLARLGALVDLPSLYPNLTGKENLQLTAMYRKCPRSKIPKVLERVGLASAADRLVKHYSTGMRQRLGLALALMHEPELLILDEPTNGLDPAGIQEIRELLRNLVVEKGVTVFLSSHLLSEVENLATHVAILHKGCLQFQGSLEAMRAQAQSCLRIGVVDSPKAHSALQHLGISFTTDSQGWILTEAHSPGTIATLNAYLMTAGCRVHHLAVERPNLETLFLQMTEH